MKSTLQFTVIAILLALISFVYRDFFYKVAHQFKTPASELTYTQLIQKGEIIHSHESFLVVGYRGKLYQCNVESKLLCWRLDPFDSGRVKD